MWWFVYGRCGCWDEANLEIVEREIREKVFGRDGDEVRYAAVAQYEARTGLSPLLNLRDLKPVALPEPSSDIPFPGIPVSQDAQAL